MTHWIEFGGYLVNLDRAELIEPPKGKDGKWVVTLHYDKGNDQRTLKSHTKKDANALYEEISSLVLAKPYVVPFKLLE